MVSIQIGSILVVKREGADAHGGSTYFLPEESRETETPENYSFRIPNGTRVRTNEEMPRTLTYFRYHKGRAHALVCERMNLAVLSAEEVTDLKLEIVEFPLGYPPPEQVVFPYRAY